MSLALDWRYDFSSWQGTRTYLLDENARLHTAHLTWDTLKKLRRQILQHPPYTPNLAILDFYLFGQLKGVLLGKHFQSNQDVEDQVQRILQDKSKGFMPESYKN